MESALLPAIRSHLEGLLSPAKSIDSSTCASLVDAQAFAGPLKILAELLALTTTEVATLGILLAHEIDPIARRLVRELSTEHVADTTLDVIRQGVYRGCESLAQSELGPSGTLRRLVLIERCDADPHCPDYRQTFKIARRVVSFILGDSRLGDELAGFASLPERELSLAEIVADASAITSLRGTEEGRLVILVGRSGSGRRSLVCAIARERGRPVLQIDGKQLSRERDHARQQLRAVARECALLERTPLICNLDALACTGEDAERRDLIESELTGTVYATSSGGRGYRWRTAPTIVELSPATSKDRVQLWERAIPGTTPEHASALAALYPLAPAMIVSAAKAVASHAPVSTSPESVAAGVRSVVDDRLGALARRITTPQTWDDIVMSEDQVTALIELLARVRHRRLVHETWEFGDKLGRGLGVAALFSGPPGTGKTMAAGLVAKDLGIDLYQVDLSKVVSKWIGETERNLGEVFDAAEAGHAILLFDEADALFGKRTEVKSSNDRHANQEVNYLLQRLESFAGVCLLTTNHETALDEAFRRRISVHVRFQLPEVGERKRLWKAMLPTAAPLAEDLQLDSLARSFAMSGGYIRNAVLRAAFLAADSNSVIDAALLARAAQLEYEAMGKVVMMKSAA